MLVSQDDLAMVDIYPHRTRAGLTQESVAWHLGISPGTVSQWEVGNSIPHSRHLPKLARLFGVSIDDLFVSLDRKDIS